jgi:hypothetical protein
MEKQTEQSLQVIKQLINLATNKGVFATIDEAVAVSQHFNYIVSLFESKKTEDGAA